MACELVEDETVSQQSMSAGSSLTEQSQDAEEVQESTEGPEQHQQDGEKKEPEQPQQNRERKEPEQAQQDGEKEVPEWLETPDYFRPDCEDEPRTWTTFTNEASQVTYSVAGYRQHTCVIELYSSGKVTGCYRQSTCVVGLNSSGKV